MDPLGPVDGDPQITREKQDHYATIRKHILSGFLDLGDEIARLSGTISSTMRRQYGNHSKRSPEEFISID